LAVSISLFLAFATFVGLANDLVLGALISILGLIVLNFLSRFKYPWNTLWKPYISL
jgi:hypothetical protein